MNVPRIQRGRIGLREPLVNVCHKACEVRSARCEVLGTQELAPCVGG